MTFPDTRKSIDFMREERASLAAFKSFHHREAKPSEIVKLSPQRAVVGFEVGRLISIGYCAAGDRKDYYHEFDRNGDARVYVRYDGKQIFILGGVYRFTSRGFVR